MLIALTAAFALGPSLLLIWYFHARDLKPEPGRVVWATFGLGVLTVIPVLLVDWPIGLVLGPVKDPYTRGVLNAFFSAAMVEEFFKFIVVYFYCSRHKEFDEPMDGIVYGAIASLGFATLENVLYVSTGGMAVAIPRAITAVPCHAFMGAIMGYFIGQAKFRANAKRGALLAAAYFIPFLLHGLYDFPILALNELTGHGKRKDVDSSSAAVALLVTIAVLIFEWVWTVRLVRRLRRQQDADIRAGAAAAHAAALASGGPVASTNAASGYVDPFAPVVAAPAAPAAAAGGYATAPVWAAPAAPAYNRVPHPPTSVGGILMIIFGAIVATVGLFFTLVLAVAVVAGSHDQNAKALVLGGLLIGVLPLVGGTLLFAFGLRKVSPKRTAAAQPLARAA